MAIIETRGLTRFYGARRGIEGVDLAVAEGSLFGFLGPNGAGKTTTIRVLLGFLRPDSGSSRVFGMDCWAGSGRIKEEVGYVPGDLRLYPWMDGRSALSIFGKVRRREMLGPGKDLAERFGLDLGVRVRAMSKGMKQKLGLVLAMAHRPRLLVLDEPSSGLDPLIQEVLRVELRALAAAGHTVFFSSHSLSEVEALCDRVAIVRDGRLVADETLGELKTRAGHAVAIRWRGGAGTLEAPEFLKVTRRDADEWEGMLEGPMEPLVRWLAGRPIDDLSIGRPDLERMFKRFYEAGGGA